MSKLNLNVGDTVSITYDQTRKIRFPIVATVTSIEEYMNGFEIVVFSKTPATRETFMHSGPFVKIETSPTDGFAAASDGFGFNKNDEGVELWFYWDSDGKYYCPYCYQEITEEEILSELDKVNKLNDWVKIKTEMDKFISEREGVINQ